MRTRVCKIMRRFFFEMINLLLHGSVYLLRKELQCVRPGPDPYAGRSVWLLPVDSLFEHLNSLLKGFILLNQSFDGLIDFIWSIRVIHLRPELNKTHFHTRIQNLTETKGINRFTYISFILDGWKYIIINIWMSNRALFTILVIPILIMLYFQPSKLKLV